MNDKETLKGLEVLRKRYTFDGDKQDIIRLAKKLRGDSLKLSLAKQKPMLELIEFLDKKIDDITYLLSWDKELSKMQKEREILFEKRECYLTLLSFFTDAKRSIKTIKNRVIEELNEPS